MAKWVDDEVLAELTDLDVLEAASRLSTKELVVLLLRALVFRAGWPDSRLPKCGPFEIHRPIGDGGYGYVFLAWDTRLHREVAIKLCAVRSAVDSPLAEARVLARLSHPNIVAVHECEQHGDTLFMVMEYVSGGIVFRYVPETWQEFVKVFAEVARAIAYAHEKGVIHGDIKPDNILLDEKCRPRVADFGLARVLGEPVAVPDVVGTVAFASPGLLAQQEVRDEHSDQWAFTASLYECIVGKPPGIELDDATKPPSTRRRMLRVLENWDGPPPLGDDIPSALQEIIRIGLSVRREDRFPDMNAMADALESLFISGLVPGAIVNEPSASESVEDLCAGESVAVKPTEPSEDTSAGTNASMVKGVGIGVAFSVFVGMLGAQIYAVKQERAESSELQRALTPTERGEQKIRAASEIVRSVRNLTERDLDIAGELWRQGVDLCVLSDEPSDRKLAAELTLELATRIHARKHGSTRAAQLAVQAAQWHEQGGHWELAAAAQEQAVQFFEAADGAPELGWAQACLASLRGEIGCEWQRPAED